MTGWEARREDILKAVAVGGGWGIDKSGKILTCMGREDCKKCVFSNGDGCCAERKKWIDAEYEKPKHIDRDNDIDWEKVPVDTPVQVRNDDSDTWGKANFAMKRDGRYYTWANGKTQWTAEGETVFWSHCHLVLIEDIEKYRKKGTDE